ncbi:unnamed protein product, partial [Rotaria sp. Silwood1]
YLIKEALRTLRNDWELYYLAHSHVYCIKVLPNNTCKASFLYCTTAYVVRNSIVARKLIKWSYSPHGGEADGTLLVYMRDGSLIAYVAHPNHIAWQDRNSWGTDISQSGPIALAYFRNRLSKILKV